jgi:hypothetical protein
MPPDTAVFDDGVFAGIRGAKYSRGHSQFRGNMGIGGHVRLECVGVFSYTRCRVLDRIGICMLPWL